MLFAVHQQILLSDPFVYLNRDGYLSQIGKPCAILSNCNLRRRATCGEVDNRLRRIDHFPTGPTTAKTVYQYEEEFDGMIRQRITP